MTEENDIPWFLKNGKENDVIIYSNLALSRNLVNFPFPNMLSDNEKKRVQENIFNALEKISRENLDFSITCVNSSSLGESVSFLLKEKKILPSTKSKEERESGLSIDSDGSFSALINYKDHLRLSFFQAGLSLRECFSKIYDLEKKLQEHLQFAATKSFGYLTSSFRSSGTGLKFSACIHIPSAIKSGKVNLITDFIKEKNVDIKPAFMDFPDGGVPGSYFEISTKASTSGSEIDQLADFESVCKFIAETERKISHIYADNKKTVIQNSLICSFFTAKASLLVSYPQALELISIMMFALNNNLITGIEQSELCGLLFRIQKSNVRYLLESANFSFEEDIQKSENERIDRFRALIIKEAFEKISLRDV